MLVEILMGRIGLLGFGLVERHRDHIMGNTLPESPIHRDEGI